MLSYILNNSYRINDQFWIKGLGGVAQTAIGATFFVQVMNFALVFLAVGGTLSMVAQSVGARDTARRDSYIRHALFFGLAIGIGLTLCVRPLLPWIVSLLGLEGEPAPMAEDYLDTLYLFMVPLTLFPVLDALFIGRGNTRVPMTLQCMAVATNYLLNPILIYGSEVAEHVQAPGAVALGQLAGALGIEGRGIGGAAMATGISRCISVVVGLAILRFGFATNLIGGMRPTWRRVRAIARISAPISISIAVFAGAYWALMGLVLTRLGSAATAGLGIGFQVFEGIAFPAYLGISIAGSSLVGRAIGARDRVAALEVVRSVRWVARVLGIFFALSFYFGAGFLVPFFTEDPDVARETVRYASVLAFSQYWVAVETANEKVLLGSGSTRAILWIAPLGNSLRVPLGWFLAISMGLGSAGVWWAINLSTLLKAFLFWRKVEERDWLESALQRGHMD